jgi:membrane-bound ClpP family serine protease
LHYSRNPLLLASAFAALFLAVANYLLFFDVLSPGVGGGSIKANMGAFFLVPVLLLTGIQILYSTGTSPGLQGLLL